MPLSEMLPLAAVTFEQLCKGPMFVTLQKMLFTSLWGINAEGRPRPEVWREQQRWRSKRKLIFKDELIDEIVCFCPNLVRKV